MKILFIAAFFTISFGAFSQRQIVGLSVTPLIDVWKPFSIPAQSLTSDRIKISSSAFLIVAQTQILQKEKWGGNVGIGYKHISYLVKDYLESFGYIHYVNGSIQIPVQHVFKDQADLSAISNSFGVNTEWYYDLLEKGRFKGVLGLSSELYVLEYYRSWYSSTDTFESSQAQLPTPNQGPGRKWFFSSMNASVFYKIGYLFKGEYTRLSLKLSAGANLYSDWEQFKRNAWVGVGVGLDVLTRKKE